MLSLIRGQERGRIVNSPNSGFTLIEVLIALAITAFVSTISYTSLSAVLDGVEGTREIADRTHEINRALMIISRDLRQFSPRPIRDEFGEVEPSMQGGTAARYLLSFTRSGWHNPIGQRRSNLQRINYTLEDEALWRESFAVLDRASGTTANRVKLLEGVEYLDLGFLSSLAAVETGSGREGLDTENWNESWVADTSTPGTILPPPVAIEITMQLTDLGEIRRLYPLPPI